MRRKGVSCVGIWCERGGGEKDCLIFFKLGALEGAGDLSTFPFKKRTSSMSAVTISLCSLLLLLPERNDLTKEPFNSFHMLEPESSLVQFLTNV